MRILVTPVGKNERFFMIQVLDGEQIIHTEKVRGIKNRDNTVWTLSDLYKASDIDFHEDVDKFKFSEIPSIPVLEESDAQDFFENNQGFIYSRILKVVEEGIQTNQTSIRLFELNGTGVYMTSHKKGWKSGLSQALQYFESVEDYEKCVIARDLMLKL